MRAGELNVKLSATGGDQVKREIDGVKRAMDETSVAGASLEDAIKNLSFGGKTLGEKYSELAGKMQAFGTSATAVMSIIGPVGSAIGGAAIAATGFGAAIVGLTGEAYRFAFSSRTAGMEFEAMQRRLEGLTGSAARAASILAMAKKEAGPSMFTTQQLEQASVMLAAYGMNVERTIPLITRLGQAFGADQEHLMMYARAFGQLAGGKMPEAEVMSQMGISKGELAQAGIQFDKQGTLLSSAEQTLTAFEQLVYQKFDAAYQSSTGTSEAMAASIEDSFQSIQRSFGLVVNDAIKPFQKAFGDMLGTISESNFPQLLAMDLMRPLQLLGGGLRDAQDAFARFAAGIGATATIIPEMVSRLIEQMQILKSNASLREKGVALLKMTPLGGLFTAGQDFAERVQDYYAAMMFKPTGGEGIDMAQMTRPFGGPPALADPEKQRDKKHKEKIERSLSSISNNTRKSADLLDLRNQTIGGGRLAGLGITGPEFARMGMRVQSDFSRAKPISADTMVNRGIKTMIQNNLGFAVNGGRAMPVR